MANVLVDQDELKELVNLAGLQKQLVASFGDLHGKLDALLERMQIGKVASPTVYGQRNQPWSSDLLGTSQSTLGLEGCLVTASASMVTDSGKSITPGELNAFLKANNGFVNDAGGYTNAKRMVWATLNKLGVVTFVNRVDCWWVDAPMTTIKQFLDARDFVLVEVDFDPDPDRDQHWVRLLDINGAIMDPWTGDVCQITKYRGKDVNECIRAVAYYKRVK